jgi:tRNA threonylcarbamoyladenosine modification (KEOPS) complex Cgi121 subunit
MGASLSAETRLAPEDAERELARLRKSNPELIIQLVSMKKPPSAKAVSMIGEQTLRAKETGALLADRPEVDLLLRLAGTSQISEGLKKSGYRSGGKIMLVAAGKEKDIERFRRVLSKHNAYSLREEGEMDNESQDVVEIAALLSTRT